MKERETLKLAYDEIWSAGSEYPIPSFDDVILFVNKLESIKESLSQPEQELCPSCRNSDIYECTCTSKRTQPSPLYTTPPQREWVGLTDDEIDQGLLRSDYAFKTAEAWRAGVVFAMTKLKEKNT